jgi:H+/Cl- antiporter ClcA
VKRLSGTLGLILGLFAGALGAITLVWEDWIETVFGVDPDGGNGSVEVLIVVVCFAVSLALLHLAWVERRRPAASHD